MKNKTKLSNVKRFDMFYTKLSKIILNILNLKHVLLYDWVKILLKDTYTKTGIYCQDVMLISEA